MSKISSGKNELEDSYLQLKKISDEFKTFALSYIEKWDKKEVNRLAKKFRFKKQGLQWLPTNSA